MLTREIYSPHAAVNRFTVPVPVANGGTAANTDVDAVHNLGGIHITDANVANGFGQLDATGKLDPSIFPVEAQGGPTLTGPSTLLIQTRGVWTITNYDSAQTYTVTCDQGFVARSGDKVYYNAPSLEGLYGFTINDKVVPVTISAHYVAQPTLLTPANTNAAISNATLTDTLFASDRVANAWFGVSIAVSADGSRLAVGANGKDVNGVADAGQVYIYTRSNDSWVQESILTAFDKATNDQFGISVALTADGSRLAVGAFGKTVSGISLSGQVYLYTRSGSSWTLESTLSASDKAAGDLFGISVAFDSTASRLAVGAHNKTVGGIAGAGQVYIYTRSGSAWTLESTLSASDKAANDQFGVSVALTADGSRLAVSALLKDVSSITDAGQVYLYTRSGSSWTLESTLSASDKAAGDYLGVPVAFSPDGSRLAVSSANKITANNASTGKLYIYVRSGNSYTEEITIVANDNGASNKQFGRGIAITADNLSIIMGASNKDSTDVLNCGAVMTYSLEYASTSKVRVGSVVNFTSSPFALSGQYLESTLVSPNMATEDRFATGVAISGDGTRLAVSSHTKTVGGIVNAGQLYIFLYTNGTWVLEATLSAPDKATNDAFSIMSSFSSSGDRLAVGAGGKDVAGVTDAGQVYIYTRSGTTWTLECTLSASDKATSDQYGSCSLSGDGSLLAIGAFNKTVSGITSAGKVYLYSRSGSVWTEIAALSASDKAINDFFGFAVSLSKDGTRLAVGSYGKTVGGLTSAGQAYIYTVSGSTLTLETTLTASDKTASFLFGVTVSLNADGSKLAVGSHTKTVNGVASAGGAYVFSRSGVTWTESLIINSPTGKPDQFGRSVSFNNDASKLVIGINAADYSANLYNTGQVYTYLMSYHEGTDWQLSSDPGFVNVLSSVTNSAANKTTWQVTDLAANTDYFVRFRHKGTTYGYSEWSDVSKLTTKNPFIPNTELTTLTASDKAANDYFGTTAALDATGSRLVVGAYNKTVGGITAAGQVYVYTRSGTTWTLEATLSANDKAASDYFGISVALDSTASRLAVGAYAKDVSGVVDAGQVYVYTRSGSAWTLESTLSASDKAAGDVFGISVSFDSTASRLAVGAHAKDVSGILNSGQVYIYVRSGSTWTLESTLSASDKAADDFFGVSVAFDSTASRLVIGAHGKDVSTITDAGQVYIYTRSGSVWTLESTLSASDKATSDQFGVSVALDATGSRLAVGAHNKTVSGVANCGQVYIYTRLGTVWSLQTTLVASDKAAGDFFGRSLAFSMDTSLLIAGSPKRDSSGLTDSGALYMFS